jgi:hypothetical protein
LKMLEIGRTALLACLSLSLWVPAAHAGNNPMRDMMKQMGGGLLSGKKLKRAVEKADKSALGSRDNPVRVVMAQGQRAYLSRLRCEAGDAPLFARSGNVGPGPFGGIVDLYAVTCAGKDPVSIYMDMYHESDETRLVPGFNSEQPGSAPLL